MCLERRMFFFLIVETSGKINCVFDESTVNLNVCHASESILHSSVGAGITFYDDF